MGPITTALSLAKFIPDVIELLSPRRGEQAREIADIVEKAAEVVTGKPGVAAISEIESNPELATAFKREVMQNNLVREQLRAADRKDARDMYKVHHEQADKIANIVMVWNIPTILFLAVLQVFVLYLADKYQLTTELVVIICNLLTLVLKALLDERMQVGGFYFGSSLGSKTKDQRDGR